MTRIEFRVYGQSLTKGSARAFYIKKLNRAVVTSTTKGLKAWESSVRHAAQSAANGKLMDGPVRMVMLFVLQRPKALKGSDLIWHAKRPDLLKLGRAVEDALINVLFHDDGQVACSCVAKRYANQGETPHVRVIVESVTSLGLANEGWTWRTMLDVCRCFDGH